MSEELPTPLRAVAVDPIDVGDPGLPSLEGTATGADLTWRCNGQDSPAIPYRGVATTARMLYVFDGRWSTSLTIGRLFNW
jgi:hypothetical protein